MKNLPKELKILPSDPKLPIIDREKAKSFRKGYSFGLIEGRKIKNHESRRLNKIYRLIQKLSELI